jgi:hypothetical protein
MPFVECGDPDIGREAGALCVLVTGVLGAFVVRGPYDWRSTL